MKKLSGFFRSSNWPLAFALGALVTTVAVAATSFVSPIEIKTCTSGQFVSAIASNGTVTCGTPSSSSGGLFNQVMSATPTSSSTGLTTWANQGGASVADGATGIVLTVPASSANNWRLRTKTGPSTPWSVKALIAMASSFDNDQIWCGIGFWDGTKIENIVLFGQSSGSPYNGVTNLGVARFSAVGTFDAWDAVWSGHNASVGIIPNLAWFGIANDGTNVIFRYSADGTTFTDLFSRTISGGSLSTYGTIAFGGNETQNNGTKCTLMSYEETSP